MAAIRSKDGVPSARENPSISARHSAIATWKLETVTSQENKSQTDTMLRCLRNPAAGVLAFTWNSRVWNRFTNYTLKSRFKTNEWGNITTATLCSRSELENIWHSLRTRRKWIKELCRRTLLNRQWYTQEGIMTQQISFGALLNTLSNVKERDSEWYLHQYAKI